MQTVQIHYPPEGISIRYLLELFDVIDGLEGVNMLVTLGNIQKKMTQAQLVAALPMLVSQNANGVDVSSNQGDFDLDKATALAKFMIFRTSVGYYKDSRIAQYWGQSQGKTIRGTYHCLYPTSTVSEATQKDRISEALKLYKGDLPFALDCEVAGVGLDLVLALGGRILNDSGKYPIIYTSPGWWGPMWGKATAGQRAAAKTFLAHCPLWVAHYTTLLDPMNVPPWDDTWDFWQYKIGGPEVALEYGLKTWQARAIDLNIYNGTLTQLKTRFGVDTPTPPPPTPPPSVKEVAGRVLAQALWFRSEPSLEEATKMWLLPKGYVVPFTGNEKREAATGILWVEVKLNSCTTGWVSKDKDVLQVIKE